MMKAMRTEGIREHVSRHYGRLGLKVLVSGEGDDAEQYVFAPDNLLPFASPKTVKRAVWPVKRAVWPGPIPKTQGGTA